MTTPRTRQAYFALYEILDAAQASPTGVRMQVESHAKATNLRMRLHSARQVDREYNAVIYERGMPLHGASVYDGLQVRLEVVSDPAGPCWIIIEPAIPRLIGQIEPITPNPEDYAWRQLPAPRPIDTTFEEAPSFLPSTGYHSGTKLLTKSSGTGSESPSEDSSSAPSTKPEPEPATNGLRRL